LVAISVLGQPPEKAKDQPEISADWLRRSGLASNAPEWAELRYLERAGEKAYPAYETILKDPLSDSRLVGQLCIIIACQKGDRSRFLPMLRNRLTDLDLGVRLWTIVAIGQIGNREDLVPLAAFLSSDHDWTAKSAASAIVKIGGEPGLRALEIWLLTTRERGDSEVRQHIRSCRDSLKKKLDEAKKKSQ
jgi:HEAT repeat protein